MTILALLHESLRLPVVFPLSSENSSMFASFVDQIDAASDDRFLQQDFCKKDITEHNDTLSSLIPESLKRAVHYCMPQLFSFTMSKPQVRDSSVKQFIAKISKCITAFLDIFSIFCTTQHILDFGRNTKRLLSQRSHLLTCITTFNKYMNHIKQALVQLKQSDTIPRFVVVCHQLILDMPLFHIPSMKFRDIISVPVTIAPVVIPTSATKSKPHKNYDDQLIEPACTRTVKLGPSNATRRFAIEGPDEMMGLIEFALDKVGIASIVTTVNPIPAGRRPTANTQAIFGSLTFQNTVFTLMLPFPHGPTDTVLVESSSSKLIPALSRSEITLKHIQKSGILTRKQLTLTDSSLLNVKKADTLITERLATLLNVKREASLDAHDVAICPFFTTTCYRQECQAITVHNRQSPLKARVRCSGCNMAEFCTLCFKSDHGGDCDVDVDQQSAQTINESTKPCPTCHSRIEKNRGCNHMKCRVCVTHFCWTCLVVFPPDNPHNLPTPPNLDRCDDSMYAHYRDPAARERGCVHIP